MVWRKIPWTVLAATELQLLDLELKLPLRICKKNRLAQLHKMLIR